MDALRIAIVCLVATCAGCKQSQPEPLWGAESEARALATIEASKDLSPEGHEITMDKYGANRIVRGIIRNGPTHNFDSVSVVFDVYDSGGVKIGQTGARIAGLRPGERGQYEAPLNDEAHSVKFASVHGWLTYEP